MDRFRNREDAGRRLAAALGRYAAERPIVLALPRGGVPVAYEVARALGAPLDVWIARKVGVPWQPELGMGAVSERGFVHLAKGLIEELGVSDEEVLEAVEAERANVERRVQRFRGRRPRPSLVGRTVVLIDDGIATGGTFRAALAALRTEEPRKVVLAVPVAAKEAVRALAAEADDVVCLFTPEDFYAIGSWYDDFSQVSDDEALRLLERARHESRPVLEHRTG